jgi:1-acyl-sn-glycerol-3-phosphate acyltransferase
MSGIKVDRRGGASALKELIKQSKTLLAQGHSIVIFPQGTRVPPKGTVEKYPYQSGIAALYLACGVKVVPTALNSGIFWGRGKFAKKPGKITLEFLKPIDPGLPKKEFMAKLENMIEKRSEELREMVSK